jgi:uncharacterized surface protein with fasciclin (FAS1) repeats
MERMAGKFASIGILALMIIAFIGSQTATAGDHGKDKAAGDIIDVAVANGQFTTLAAALEAADLVGTLQGDGPFTVFAPTDAAFAALPEGTVESLLQPENREQLIAILTYHVVAGRVTAADVIKLDAAQTVNGQSVAIKTDDKGVKINDARVIMADVDASNGIIHVIDTVILPN